MTTSETQKLTALIQAAKKFVEDLEYHLPELHHLRLAIADAEAVLRENEEASLLEWLQDKEANLITFREKLSEEEIVLWQVVKGKESLSGHPVGSPIEALDFAMEKNP